MKVQIFLKQGYVEKLNLSFHIEFMQQDKFADFWPDFVLKAILRML